jgi:hypothetical protein
MKFDKNHPRNWSKARKQAEFYKTNPPDAQVALCSLCHGELPSSLDGDLLLDPGNPICPDCQRKIDSGEI